MFVCSVFAVYTEMMYQAKEVLCFKVYTINMFVVSIFSSTYNEQRKPLIVVNGGR